MQRIEIIALLLYQLHYYFKKKLRNHFASEIIFHNIKDT